MPDEPYISPPNPFGEGMGLRITAAADGRSTTKLAVTEALYNPNRVLHGGALFSMADNGMGAALFTQLAAGESCSTIEIKINFLRPVTEGELVCETAVVHKGRTTAVLESTILNDGKMVARAQGTYAVLQRPPRD